jgi:hypothetical protein
MQRVERKNTSTLKLNSRIRRSNNEKRFAHVWFARFFGLKLSLALHLGLCGLAAKIAGFLCNLLQSQNCNFDFKKFHLLQLPVPVAYKPDKCGRVSVYIN